MTRVLHTARINNIESITCVIIMEMVNFELGKSMTKMKCSFVTSVGQSENANESALVKVAPENANTD